MGVDIYATFSKLIKVSETAGTWVSVQSEEKTESISKPNLDLHIEDFFNRIAHFIAAFIVFVCILVVLVTICILKNNMCINFFRTCCKKAGKRLVRTKSKHRVRINTRPIIREDIPLNITSNENNNTIDDIAINVEDQISVPENQISLNSIADKYLAKSMKTSIV